jgi:hypothetical protein
MFEEFGEKRKAVGLPKSLLQPVLMARASRAPTGPQNPLGSEFLPMTAVGEAVGSLLAPF